MEPVLLGPGEGERVSDNVVIKLDRDELCVTESDYPPGQSGPGPHIHEEHCDSFYVLDGELTFLLGDAELKLGAGGFVMVPPGIVHTFRNAGPGAARFLNFHAPSMGFAEHLRSDAPFDSFDPPEDGGLPASGAVVLEPGEGDAASMGPTSLTFKAERGEMSMTEQHLGPAFPGPPPHRHETFTDSFYVLEGTLTFLLGDRRVEAGPGTYAAAPAGQVHTFSNASEEPVRSLNLMAPGGFEQYLRELAKLVGSGRQPQPEEIAALASQHDFHVVSQG